jgi:DNA-binding NarL/FixJ family response regulator
LATRPRVLLADDYPEMTKAVGRLLAVDCEIVGSVADGGEVVEAAHRLQPDVVVLDMHLPNVDSVEACREITGANPGIKVIMFTVFDDPNARQRYFEAGAAAFVSKLSSADLLSTIKRLCLDGG